MTPLIASTIKRSTNRKIANLASNFCANARADDQQEFDAWTEAARTLSREDHYVLVLISAAGTSGRPRGDFLKLLIAALIIVGIIIVISFLVTRSLGLRRHG